MARLNVPHFEHQASTTATEAQKFLILCFYRLTSTPEQAEISSMSMETEFLRAIIRSDIDSVERMLLEGIDPDFETDLEYTPLYYAIKYSSPRVMRLLLEYGADPNTVDPEGRSHLYRAIEIESEEAVFRFDVYGLRFSPLAPKTELLLEFEAVPHDMEKRGDLIAFARRRDHKRAVKLLMDKGAVDPAISHHSQDVWCQQCKVVLSEMINGKNKPPIEKIQQAGAFYIPRVGWFCSQPCGDRFEAESSVRFTGIKMG